ncbi:class I SAM-dependent methyltransferase [Streptacidiphilus rugosus]|uniref:class I SAM-dependent methyltransferase n=1 Tax=Streptacidiphilus rugosus TaxID=405783 RepID=UPI00055CFCCB|nr:class I SAM-dependent methyltransferase [Streptacidiphilus rugosus]
MGDAAAQPGTIGEDYTERLVTLEKAGLKRFLPTQAPYHWNLRRLRPGRTLDVGCGVGRNLKALGPDSIGVDHNATSIATARSRGFNAFTDTEFLEEGRFAQGSFDSMLCAHVLEHMDADLAGQVLKSYLPYIRHGGLVILICPQEAGYASDATHVRFVDPDGLRAHAEALGVTERKSYSFPLPRAFGKSFTYNEFVFVGRIS